MAKTNKTAAAAQPQQPSLLAGLSVSTGPTKRDPKKDRLTVEVAGLEEYAALSTNNNEIEKGHMKAHPIKKILADTAFATGLTQGHGKNLNFDAVEGVATGSMQLRIKDSQSKLDQDLVDRLHAAKIRTFRHVIVPGALIINPAYRNDVAMLEKILQIMKAAGYDTNEVFQLQNEVAYDIVCEETLDDIFSPKTELKEDQRREFFEQVTIPVVVPKYNGTLAEAVAIATKVVLPKGAKSERVDTTTITVKRTTNGSGPPSGKPDFMTQLTTSLALENVKAQLPVNAQGAFALPANKPPKGRRSARVGAR